MDTMLHCNAYTTESSKQQNCQGRATAEKRINGQLVLASYEKLLRKNGYFLCFIND
jgi:hypothetical protein